MNFRIDNPVILLGLFALAVPIVLHFLKRRRLDVLDWGAMQFLPESISIQRRHWLDEILLLLMRLGIITLIVLALATPISTSGWLGGLQDRSTRDVVLVLDGSLSMDVRLGDRPSPAEDAIREAKNQIAQASPGDRFAVLLMRRPRLWVLEEFTNDRERLLAAIDRLPRPRGNPDFPGSLAEAWARLLTQSRASRKEIVVFTDKQIHGLADSAALKELETLGEQWRADVAQAQDTGDAVPSLRLVGVGAELPRRVANFALAPVIASRNVVKLGQEVTVRSALRLAGFDKVTRPARVTLSIDGKAVHDFASLDRTEVKDGQIPLSHSLRFKKEGRRLVSFAVKPTGEDALAVDNEQHAVVEVVKELDILLVDGDRKLGAEGSSFFLQRALSAPNVAFGELNESMMGPGLAAAPGVLVLADVPRLEPAQIDAIDRFLARGGAVLIAVGERVVNTRAFYNHQLYREGKGWLPARLIAAAAAADGTQPDTRTFQHPALELFRASPDAGMKAVRFGTWWKVEIGPQDRATPIARFANDDPFLIEMTYKKGRVILCTAPLDRRWGSTFPSGAEFPVLVNELVYYLAGAGESRAMLRPGEPIRMQLPNALGQQVRIKTPEDNLTADVKSLPWTYANTGAVGTYQVRTSSGDVWPFVVAPDPRESDLTRCTEFDLRKIRDRLPIPWADEQTEAPSIEGADDRREELWWLLLSAVLAIMCMEVWMTRRMAQARGR